MKSDVILQMCISGLLAYLCLTQKSDAAKASAGRNGKMKPGACQTCSQFVTSFRKGMERTARYNFGGGDVHWEELKLGSYKNSELRLVEILETICEELDKTEESLCHHFAEDRESVIETWWFKNQDSSPDFHKWLCIDKLEVCCAEGTFGAECKACAQCKGAAKCNGNGTRQGTGECDCEPGYHGDACAECERGYYEKSRDDSQTKCEACHISCKESCWDETPKGCNECKTGWTFSEEEGCEDVDECKGSSGCSAKQYCDNTPGSYKCLACHSACEKCFAGGHTGCISCKSGFEMHEGRCEDVDECKADVGVCELAHEECFNTIGHYSCKCQAGFTRKGRECMPRKSVVENKDEQQEVLQTSEKPVHNKNKRRHSVKSGVDDDDDDDDDDDESDDDENDDDNESVKMEKQWKRAEL